MARGTEIGRGYIAVTVDEGGARAALRGFVGFAGSAFKAAAVSAGVLIGAAAKIGVEFNSMKEQAQIAFSTLLGSGDKAQAMLADLTKFAASTPFELPGLIDNARSLLGVGQSAERVIPIMGALGNAAGALGLNQDAFNRVMLATVQAFGKGKLQGDELLQMVEAGIPVWNLLSKATGKTVPELQKMSEQGKLLSNEVLPKLFEQMNKDYGGAMAAQSKTLVGQWSSLKDNGRILVATAMKPLFDEAKNVVGVLGELAASDGATQFAQRFARDLESGIDTMKRWGDAAQEELGDDLGRLTRTARARFDELWPVVAAGARDAVTAAGEIGRRVLPELIRLATTGTGLVKPALEVVASVLQTVRENSDELGDGLARTVSIASAVAGPALAILGQILKLVGFALESVVNLVGALSGPLSFLTGGVLAGIIAWRAFSAVLSGMQAVWGRVAPAAVAASLTTMTSKIDDVALRAGVMTEKLTGSATAGERVAVSGSKVGTILSRVGSAIPIVGLAVVGLGLAFEASAKQAEENAQSARNMADALLKGGEAANQARRHIEQLRAMAEQLDFGSVSEQLNAQADAIEEAYRKQLQSMTDVERAQAKVNQAQQDYLLIVRQHGQGSEIAASASRQLTAETKQLELEQQRAARAAKTHEQSLADLANQALAAANSDLQLRQSRLGVKTAQEELNKVNAEGTATANQVQAAELAVEGAMIRSAEAAKQKALADTQGKTASEQSSAATAAYNNELIRMASEAGTNAPASLLRLIAGLDQTQIEAMGGKVSFDKLGNAIISVPGHKPITITSNMVAAADDALTLKRRVEAIPVGDKYLTYHIRTLLDANTVQTGGLPVTRAHGGPIKAGIPTIVNEHGGQGELITPLADGYVHNTAHTRALLQGGGAGVHVENLNVRALSDRFSLAQVSEELHYAGVH